jgi:hypothetical protein
LRPQFLVADAILSKLDHRRQGVVGHALTSELGPTRLAFLEYLLIGVAGLAFPGLLNREGLAR